MDDLISRQAAIDICNFAIDLWHGQLGEGIVIAVRKKIVELPSAQPELIYCRDCKWYGRADKRRFYRGMDCLNKHIATIVPDRDFCSKAERRTDGVDS